MSIPFAEGDGKGCKGIFCHLQTRSLLWIALAALHIGYDSPTIFANNRSLIIAPE
jgi:hypothetical protein